MATPVVGKVYDGYRFRGGDPNDEANWEPVETESHGLEGGLVRADFGEAPWYAKPVMGGMGAPRWGPSVLESLEALPGASGMVGGLVGGVGGSVPGAIGGAALGGAAGEAGRQLLRRGLGATAPETSPEAAGLIAKRGLEEGALEGVGVGMGKAARALSSPGRAGLQEGVEAAARRQGVKLPASARTASRPVQYIEGAAAEGIGGSAIERRARNAMNQLVAQSDQLVKRASKLESDSQRGEVIANGLKEFKGQWIKMKNRLYENAEKELPNLSFTADDTVRLLRDILEEKSAAGSILQGGPVADRTFYEGLLEGLTERVYKVTAKNGEIVYEGANKKTAQELAKRLKVAVSEGMPVPREITGSQARAAMKELGEKVRAAMADPFAAANKGRIKQLSATLDEDFQAALREQAPEVAVRLQIAHEAYKEGLGKINSAFGQAIHKFARQGQYDKIMRAVVNSGMSLDDIPKILEVAGEEGTEAIRAGLLADVIARAKNASGNFTPLGLSRAMQKYGRARLEAILTPEQFSKLQDLSDITRAMEGSRKILEGSPTAGKLQVGTLGGAVGGGAVAAMSGNLSGLGAALAYVLGQAGFNKFVGSGAGQRWLTTGFPLAGNLAGDVLRQAPRSVATGVRMKNVEE